METKGRDDILKAHEEFARRIQEQVEMIRAGRATSAEVSVRMREGILEEQKQRLNELIEAREQAIKRLDEEINRRKALVTSLENEIAEIKKSVVTSPAPEPAPAQQPDAANEDEQAEPSEPVKEAAPDGQAKAGSEKKPKPARGKNKTSKQTEKK